LFLEPLHGLQNPLRLIMLCVIPMHTIEGSD
jgi:hypothetical protein